MEVSVKVTKEAYELADGLRKFVLDIKGALADGWQPGQDLPVVSSAAMADLVPAVQGVDKLGEESKADLLGFINGLVLPAEALAVALLKKPGA